MRELARKPTDGAIDPKRETLRTTQWPPQVAALFGTRVAETILASVHVRAQQQAGHMNASDPIKTIKSFLARSGPSTYGSWTEHLHGWADVKGSQSTSSAPSKPPRRGSSSQTSACSPEGSQGSENMAVILTLKGANPFKVIASVLA